MMVSSTTSTEPDVGQDWLYVHSPTSSALAGFAKSANRTAGMIISHRLFTIYQPAHLYLIPTFDCFWLATAVNEATETEKQ